MATFDPNRVGPGTFELVRDATTGNYSIKEVGFTKISPLNLPDLDTTAATTTATQTKTATDTTGDTLSQQTKMAFNMPDTGGDNQPMTTGSMLQQARQTSDMLSDTFTRPNMRDVAGDRITSPLDIQSPTERVFDRPNMRDVAGEVQQTKPALELDKPTVQQTATERVGKARIRGPGDLEQPSQTTVTDANKRFLPSNIATRSDQGEMVAPGINVATPSQTALDMDRFAGVSQMGALAGDEKDDVKPVKRSALETVSTSLRSTKDSILSKIKTPGMMLLDAMTPDLTAVNKHNTSYFTDRGDGRIGGNPATDLYAGMNRVSAFGNLEKAGEKRISTREKTIEKKGYGPGDKFYDDTQKMKDQQSGYKASLDKNVTTKREAGRMNQPGSGGDSSGRSGGKIVCTMMNESYGFGSFRNKIWLRHSKNLAPEYQIGYHRIFLPLVKKAKTNKIIKKILEHIAIHRTIDIRQEERNKIHLLGRVYRTILEPICYWVGKI
jgi:hypothetical protein